MNEVNSVPRLLQLLEYHQKSFPLLQTRQMMEVHMKYEVILFDMDDTLFDFRLSEEEALQKTFLEFGMPKGVSDYRRSYREISSILWGELEQGMIMLSELKVERFRRLFLKHGLEVDAKEFGNRYLENLGKGFHLKPGAEKLCKNLSDYRLAVLSNGFHTVQDSRIKRSALNNTFVDLITSERAGYQKPDSRIFDYAFSKLQIEDKDRVLIVGDSLTSDIKGGVNYGIDTCWFNPDHRKNCTDVLPTYEIQELTDLQKILSKSKCKENFID